MVSCVKENDGFIPFEHCIYDNYSDAVNHPPHYTNSDAECDGCGKKIECIDVTRHHSFNIGNAIKYLWRCEHKGNAIQDLQKAAWYINDEIKKRLLQSSEVGVTPIDK